MTDRELMQQAMEALEACLLANMFGKPKPYLFALTEAAMNLRERLVQPEQETETQKLSDETWAALWEEFADESEFTTDEEFQQEMVKKHGKGHYYMDAEETWNRQKDLIQKLVNARLKEQNA